ncbi:hypothetical protein OROGR_008986 [Orobanche gracilis]
MGFSPFYVVYDMVPRAPIDLLYLLSYVQAEPRTANIISDLQHIHAITKHRLELANSRYKASVDSRRFDAQFDVGNFVYVVFMKDRSLLKYNKLKSQKIGPVKIIEKINPNAYVFDSPFRTSDVFNVKHLVPFLDDNSSGDEVASD